VVCKKATRHGQKFITTGSRIYLFQLTGSGRISGYSLVQGGLLGPAVVGGTSSVPDQILVINTLTGARAVWHGWAKVFGARVLSFTNESRELVFLGTTRCTPARTSGSCRELRAVSHPAAGGQLGNSRLLLPLSALIRSPLAAQCRPYLRNGQRLDRSWPTDQADARRRQQRLL
jgi:hypothetical protein